MDCVFLEIAFVFLLFLLIKDSSELPQLSSPGDDGMEIDSSLNTETTSQYVWVSHQVQHDHF